jgi:Flp pilus assembly protein TadD
MKNKFPSLFVGIIAVMLASTSGCDNADFSKNALLSTGTKVGNGVLQGSISEFSKAIELEQKSATALAGRGAIKYTMKDTDGAMADFTKAIEIDPKYATAYSGRAWVKISNGDIQGATIDFISAGKLMALAMLSKE